MAKARQRNMGKKRIIVIGTKIASGKNYSHWVYDVNGDCMVNKKGGKLNVGMGR